MTYNEKKKAILACFMANIAVLNRLNYTANRLHNLFYDDAGNFLPEDGRALYDYLVKLDSAAKAIEQQPRDYSLLNYI